jgi:hypothetical protein
MYLRKGGVGRLEIFTPNFYTHASGVLAVYANICERRFPLLCEQL